jgi:hypothetical protein
MSNFQQSCERVRLALEQFEPEKDMESFVYSYGTGNAIPNPPVFVNYANPDSSTAAAQRTTSRPANFQRVTDRPREFFPPSQPPADDELDSQANTAGVGAGGGRSEPSAPIPSRPSSRQSTRNPLPNQGPGATSTASNGRGGMNVSQAATAQGAPVPNEPVMLKVGDRAYPVDPTNNPQESRAAPALNGTPPAVGHDNDPLAITMRQLQGSIRRPQQAEPQQAPVRPAHQQKDSTSSQLSPPPGGRGGGPPNKLDYRRSAEFVVGGPPPMNGSSRPASPNPPTAVLAIPPVQPQDDTVRNVLADYQQSFPGERKSISRPGSRAGSISVPNPLQQAQQPAQRPMSSNSMVGVGAQGRSPSPQPFRPPSRAASPMQQPTQPPMQPPMQPSMQRGVAPVMNRNVSPAAPPSQLPPQNMSQPINGRRTSMRSTTGSYGSGVATPYTQANGVGPGHQSRQNSIAQPMQRSVSPNPVGIALDRNGRVVDDELANQYPARGYQAPHAPQQPGYGAMQQPQAPGYAQPIQAQPMQAQPQRGYGGPQQPQTTGYGQNQGQYVQHAPPPQAVAPPPPQQPPYGQQQYGQFGQPDYGRPNGAPALGGHPQQGYYTNPTGQQYPPQSYGVQRAPSPRAPSPQPMQQQTSPTGAYTDDGRPILFYGKSRCSRWGNNRLSTRH